MPSHYRIRSSIILSKPKIKLLFGALTLCKVLRQAKLARHLTSCQAECWREMEKNMPLILPKTLYFQFICIPLILGGLYIIFLIDYLDYLIFFPFPKVMILQVLMLFNSFCLKIFVNFSAQILYNNNFNSEMIVLNFPSEIPFKNIWRTNWPTMN